MTLSAVSNCLFELLFKIVKGYNQDFDLIYFNLSNFLFKKSTFFFFFFFLSAALLLY